MISRRWSSALCVLLALFPLGAAWAQGTSGAQFLGIGMGARSMGMGGAFVSVAEDGSALYWNPAGLTTVSGSELTVSHVSWFDDVGYQFASLAWGVGEKGAVGLALERGSVGSWDNTGEGDMSADDFCGAVGYGRRLGSKLGVGGSFKYIGSSLGESDAASYAFDVGAVYRPTASLSLGAAARNVGQNLTYQDDGDPLPALLALGGSYAWRDLLFAVDLEKQNDLSAVTRVGLEYRPLELLALRTGMVLGEESAMSTFTGGVGLNWKRTWGLDYAYRPSELGGTHWFALSTRFGGGEGVLPFGAAGVEESVIKESTVPQANLTVITELTREVVNEAVTKMAIAEPSEIYTNQVDQHAASWLVESILLEELTAEGHVVMVGSMPTSTDEDLTRPRYEIAYRIVSLGTTYPRAWREWWIGKKKVERRVDVDLHFKLSEPEGAIVWAGQANRERRDIVSGDRMGELASPELGFTSPEMESEGWDKVIEPLVVAGIVGGLIYLFYTSETTQ